MTFRLRRVHRPGREDGIALMVVMVVFVILYLVVFQLHYSTKLEERLSKARSSDAQGSVAIQSVANYILGLIAEDYSKAKQSSSSSASSTGTDISGTAKSGTGKSGSVGKDGAPAGSTSSTGTAPMTLADSGTGSGSTVVDYLHKSLFLENQQSLNGTTVKISIVDNESGLDLNRIWDYAPSQVESLTDKNQEQAEKDSRTKADNAAGTALAKANPRAAAALKGAKSKSTGTTKKSSVSKVSDGASGEAAGTESAEGVVEEWEPPSEERRVATAKMLTRAIDMMYRLNVENGFDYRVLPPEAAALADSIERYAYDRRSRTYQNYIHLTSELLNVLALLGAGPEVYYGPKPEILPGQEFLDRNQEYRYTKDNFGDLVGEYLLAMEESEEEKAMVQQELSQLQSMYGQFASFPQLGRQGDPMTRNMKEYSEETDELGITTLKVPPMPIGLKDLFCSRSSGKININTAPVPILYALLDLIIETEPSGETMAQGIALNIEAYRNTYQPEYDASDPTEADQSTKNAGAPHREPVKDAQGNKVQGGKKAAQKAAAGSLVQSGAAGMAGLTDEELAKAAQGDSNYETNYFTNLSQLKLIDGEEGGKDDYLNEQNSGVQKIGLEDRTPLQKVIHDYEQVMVFGSTYFRATLKSKTEESPAVKTGYLTILRDTKNKRMEVVQWKELQW